MTPKASTLTLPQIRRIDSNTLLRLYDLALARLTVQASRIERARIERAVRRIEDELRGRGISV